MLALDTRKPPEDEVKRKPGSDSEGTDSDEDTILCAFCKAPVTHGRHRVDLNGTHEHHFVNPAGIFFHLGCFGQAAGCQPVGKTTVLDTWFEGYGWRLAPCATCGEHLGWHFEGSSKAPFFGLVLDRLSESS
jgi:hypothetical protein